MTVNNYDLDRLYQLLGCNKENSSITEVLNWQYHFQKRQFIVVKIDIDTKEDIPILFLSAACEAFALLMMKVQLHNFGLEDMDRFNFRIEKIVKANISADSFSGQDSLELKVEVTQLGDRSDMKAVVRLSDDNSKSKLNSIVLHGGIIK